MNPQEQAAFELYWARKEESKLQDVIESQQRKIDALQDRMTKMEILLTMYDPEWETARIFSEKPLMTDEEMDAIFGEYKDETSLD